MLKSIPPALSTIVLKTEITDTSIRQVLHLDDTSIIHKEYVAAPTGWTHLLIKSTRPEPNTDEAQFFLIIWKTNKMAQATVIPLLDLYNPSLSCLTEEALKQPGCMWKVNSYTCSTVVFRDTQFITFTAVVHMKARDWSDPYWRSSDARWEVYTNYIYSIAVSSVKNLNKLVNQVVLI